MVNSLSENLNLSLEERLFLLEKVFSIIALNTKSSNLSLDDKKSILDAVKILNFFGLQIQTTNQSLLESKFESQEDSNSFFKSRNKSTFSVKLVPDIDSLFQFKDIIPQFRINEQTSIIINSHLYLLKLSSEQIESFMLKNDPQCFDKQIKCKIQPKRHLKTSF